MKRFNLPKMACDNLTGVNDRTLTASDTRTGRRAPAPPRTASSRKTASSKGEQRDPLTPRRKHWLHVAGSGGPRL